ncbi:MAG: YggS family pyridoxal phosphate-dependent enzyme [Gammaproteobacteria bacterium]|nr:YggS family pyridoxal phosphate-dependent enzyme [Gammaproteobacteria bacterium]MDH5629728.1 YggS family pyridoxal phosphate-dependent enzyme [Gammaproteobacteria bacterium]
MTIANKVQQIRGRIETAVSKSPFRQQHVRLLAVSKTHSASAIQAAYESDLTEFGESYLQEAIDKIEQCKHLPITWHFIGPIQSNKTRAIAENFDWVQSIDREKILLRLNDQRPKESTQLQICIQANIFNEDQKQGADLTNIRSLLDLAMDLPNIKPRGLMVIPPMQTDYESQSKQFAEVYKIYTELQQDYPVLDTLSMGMSGDMQAAIINGSNMVRIGTDIFGKRNKK